MEQFIEQFNAILWGMPMLVFLLACSVYFTVRTRFFQILKIKKIVKTVVGSFRAPGDGISPFTAMAAALGGTLGTGNIIGTASAIVLGGPGAVFWMVASAFFSMMTKYAEILFAVKYRQTDSAGRFHGGPMYYMEKGLNMKFLGVLFALIGMVASLGMGNFTQANAISASFHTGFFSPALLTGLLLCAVLFFSLLGNTKRVFKIVERLIVPAGLLFVLGTVIVIVYYRSNLPAALTRIVQGAFSLKAVAGGGLGVAMRYGISRGLFTNEAGLGSAPIAHAAADAKNPQSQAIMGIFEVFADTIVMCSLTSLMILCSGADRAALSPADMASAAFLSVFGKGGLVFVTLSVGVFGIASMLSWSVYGAACVKYLFGGKWVKTYQTFFCLAGFFGCLLSLDLVWGLADTFNALMLLPNLAAILLLSLKKSHRLI